MQVLVSPKSSLSQSKNYPKISYSDLQSLAAVCTVKVISGSDVSSRAGRPDADSKYDSVPEGRLPDATQGCPHLRNVFNIMGFSDQEILALSVAHTVGICYSDRSGWISSWTKSKLSFDNSYFVNLTQMKLTKKIKESGFEVLVTDSQSGIIMLPTDLALLTYINMAPWVELYAKDSKRWEIDFASAFTKLQ